MNFLAHAYLSFNTSEILVGNMISDFVKGKKQYDYPPLVQKGIKLHRSIDDFTDTHPSTHAIRKYFQPVYGLYSGAFVDIVYDYFLANDEKEFAGPDKLFSFAKETYEHLLGHVLILPDNFQQGLAHMTLHNWLYNYRYTWGIHKSFTGMVNRAKYMSDADTAFTIFEDNIHHFKPHFDHFFPLLKNHAADTFQQLLHAD